MTRRDRLLVDRLHRYGVDLIVATGFQQPLRIGAIGLVSSDVPMHVVRGQQEDRMPKRLQPSRPIVR